MLPWRKFVAGLSGKASFKESAAVVQNITNTTIQQLQDVTPASTTNAGVVEIATVAEIDTGIDNGRAISPYGLINSNYGEVIFGCLVEGGSTSLGTGDSLNGNYFRIPSTCNGWNIVAVSAQVYTVGSTGTSSFQLRNVTDSVDVLSTKLTIDSGEKDSSTAATAAVISGTAMSVATGDQFTWDVDTVSTVTAPKGLYCETVLRHA